MNRRLVRDRLILHAIHEAYRNILPGNVFPATLLFLEMPYDEVDVNVHPAKIEVRFRRSQFVHDFTRDAIRQALMGARPIASFAAAARRRRIAAAERRRVRSPFGRCRCAARRKARRRAARIRKSRRSCRARSFRRWKKSASAPALVPTAASI